MEWDKEEHDKEWPNSNDIWEVFGEMLKKHGTPSAMQDPSEQKEESKEEVNMSSVEEFLIVTLKELFHIDHFMTDQGNHIFIDNDPALPKELPWYFKEKQIWRFTPEELKTKLLDVQASLSQVSH